MSVFRVLLSVIFPPLAVLDKGCGSVLIVTLLTCAGWIPGVIGALVILNKDPEVETNHWGSFYLHPEEVDPGLYDFVFIYDNKVFATMLTRFYKPDELYGKPDSDLERLMSQSQS